MDPGSGSRPSGMTFLDEAIVARKERLSPPDLFGWSRGVMRCLQT